MFLDMTVFQNVYFWLWMFQQIATCNCHMLIFIYFVALVLSLVDAAFDKKCDVRNDLKVALCNLGRKQPELVLSTCNCYLQKHQQVRMFFRSG